MLYCAEDQLRQMSVSLDEIRGVLEEIYGPSLARFLILGRHDHSYMGSHEPSLILFHDGAIPVHTGAVRFVQVFGNVRAVEHSDPSRAHRDKCYRRVPAQSRLVINSADAFSIATKEDATRLFVRLYPPAKVVDALAAQKQRLEERPRWEDSLADFDY